jgi:hypothetical protein
MVPAHRSWSGARGVVAHIAPPAWSPSLDEMCHVAAEMQREGFDIRC